MLSVVCSVGNVPPAAVLGNGGSSFRSVLAFIYADLIVLPILNIYRKHYGLRGSAFLFVTMYVSMVPNWNGPKGARQLKSLDFDRMPLDSFEKNFSGTSATIV